MAQRTAVDVVVPFGGALHELIDLLARLDRLELGPDDTLVVVDNRPPGSAGATSGARSTVLRAPERQSSYFARNRGAESGRNPWIVFLDADVDPPPDLIERYFAHEPGESTAVLSGSVLDEPLALSGRQPVAARYAALRATMSQLHTLDRRWAYVQTANCAVRRDPFEAVEGFRDDVRSGGDADLCFRLRAAGWRFEPREDASVVHRSRRAMRALLRQQARHGSGAAWLDRTYPGSFPRAHWLGLGVWSLRSFASALYAALRGQGDDALGAAIDPLVKWAFEIGRLFPNEVSGK
ncbi:MAG TPA: glycosyltransferase [Thermoleophilaceae bacterium]